jgi:hypothetical protein
VEIIEAQETTTDRASIADEPCTAEQAECSCPDFCERDHEQD